MSGKRRGHGDGSIHKRADGRWVAVVDLGWRDGRRQRKYLYGTSRADVRDKLRKAQNTVAQGLPLPDDRHTVGEFLEWWIIDVLPGTVRPSTAESYADLVRRHVIPQVGRVRLAKLSPRQVHELLAALTGQGLSPRTVQYVHAILRRALGRAERWGMVNRNVATLVDPPKVTRAPAEPLTPDEVDRLLKAVEGDRLEALYTVAVAVGLRKGEALALCWSDIDLDVGVVQVRQTLRRVAGELRFVEPKTKRSRRTVPLPATCVAALHRHRMRQDAERAKAASLWQDHGLVFPSRLGTPFEPRNLTRHFHRLCQKAGIERRRFHDLRHTCASLLLRQNVHPRIVMEILGHSGIQVTMDTYSHVMPVLQREAAEQMDQALGYERDDDSEEKPK